MGDAPEDVNMTTQVEATFTNGVLKPDTPLLLPDKARVRLTIDSIDEWSLTTAREAWEVFKALAEQHPIDSGGVRFTRDALHERR
jgi:predicted DNA-binding antitoxin AbrB/MazE fold protein